MRDARSSELEVALFLEMDKRYWAREKSNRREEDVLIIGGILVALALLFMLGLAT